MSSHRCPSCDTETQYQVFSGGREWYCPGCGADGPYPPESDTPPPTVLPASPTPGSSLRDQIAEALRTADAWAQLERRDDRERFADAVMAVVQPELDARDAEIARLRELLKVETAVRSAARTRGRRRR